MENTLLSTLIALFPKNTSMQLPPNIFIDMEGEFTEFIKDEKLVARFPNKERYANPFGFMQGGMIVAAMDNTLSPLSYANATANIMSEIKTSFKRPIKATDRFIEVIATVLNITATHITLQANVLNEKGKLAATGIAECVIIKGNRQPN